MIMHPKPYAYETQNNPKALLPRIERATLLWKSGRRPGTKWQASRMRGEGVIGDHVRGQGLGSGLSRVARPAIVLEILVWASTEAAYAVSVAVDCRSCLDQAYI